jgi:hypothetical protein
MHMYVCMAMCTLDYVDEQLLNKACTHAYMRMYICMAMCTLAYVDERFWQCAARDTF